MLPDGIDISPMLKARAIIFLISLMVTSVHKFQVNPCFNGWLLLITVCIFVGFVGLSLYKVVWKHHFGEKKLGQHLVEYHFNTRLFIRGKLITFGYILLLFIRRGRVLIIRIETFSFKRQIIVCYLRCQHFGC